MSNQYPGGYNSPMGGHRGQFNSPQHQQQQQQQMINQMGGNTMDVTQSGGSGGNNPMTTMAGYGPGGQVSAGMMAQQQQQQQQPGGVGQLNQVGMQSPSHMQQAQQQQQHQQSQMMQMQMGGMVGQGNAGQNPGHLPQSQHMSPHHIQAANVPQTQTPGQMNLPVQQQQQQQQQKHQQSLQQHGMQPQQQGPPPPPPASNTTTMAPHKEINIVQLSRLGQETVQDITSRFQEVLSVLKIIQPTQNRDNNTEKKVQEHFRTIRLLFKRVRIIFEKCNDGYPQETEYSNVEALVPMRDEPEPRFEGAHCEEYRKVIQENQELIETVKLKNRQLREIIDRTRIIIWEINTMLAMRRS